MLVILFKARFTFIDIYSLEECIILDFVQDRLSLARLFAYVHDILHV